MSVQVFRFTLLISEGLFTYFQKTVSSSSFLVFLFLWKYHLFLHTTWIKCSLFSKHLLLVCISPEKPKVLQILQESLC